MTWKRVLFLYLFKFHSPKQKQLLLVFWTSCTRLFQHWKEVWEPQFYSHKEQKKTRKRLKEVQIAIDILKNKSTFTFSRRFYPKRLTLHSSYSFYILSALAFPGNRTHDLGIANAMLYQLSYRKSTKMYLKYINAMLRSVPMAQW